MRSVSWLVAANVATDFLPFTDIVSDVVLLASVWPSTEMIAPDNIEGCGERALW